MKTEVVVPLCSTLADQHWEGLVRGWRDVAHGLEFLHYKVNQMVQLWYCSTGGYWWWWWWSRYWDTGGGSACDSGILVRVVRVIVGTGDGGAGDCGYW